MRSCKAASASRWHRRVVLALRSPYSPSPKGDVTRTDMLRQALAKPSLLNQTNNCWQGND
ncbi:hypothetical protein [Nostoc sp.]|uniref:hypothetical protein n=1 Tax=Nostoc sp. TaxID=1180 RepID=UPI002FF97CD3